MPDHERDDAVEHDDDAVGGQILWSGTLTFGLVSIPVAMLSAVHGGGLPLRMVDAQEHAPLSRRYYCPAENVEVHREHLQRGYEVEDGQFVVVREDELASLEPRKSRDIDLRQFVKRDALEPLLFERSYYLAPARGGAKAYHLLAQSLERRGRAGVATFVMRGKEYLAAVLARQGVLRVQTLRFHDEVRDPGEMGLTAAKASPVAVKAMAKVVAGLTRATLKTGDLHDERTRRLAKLVQAKDERDEDIVEVAVEAQEESSTGDLMAALQRSLAEADEKAAKGKSSRGSGRVAKGRPRSGAA